MLKKISFILFSLGFVIRCSTADQGFPGRCLPVAGGKYVASSSDKHGDWSITVQPEGTTIECKEAGETGEIAFYSIVKNGSQSPVGGVSVTPVLSGASSSSLEEASYQTDSCGVATANIKWVCPAADKADTIQFYMISGALWSSVMTFTVRNATSAERAAPQQQQPTTVVVPSAQNNNTQEAI